MYSTYRQPDLADYLFSDLGREEYDVYECSDCGEEIEEAEYEFYQGKCKKCFFDSITVDDMQDYYDSLTKEEKKDFLKEAIETSDFFFGLLDREFKRYTFADLDSIDLELTQKEYQEAKEQQINFKDFINCNLDDFAKVIYGERGAYEC